MTAKPVVDARGGTHDADAEFMRSFCSGREEAFVELYRRYRDRIYNFCRRMLRAPALAEEATQDVFLKLYRARAVYVARSRFSTYLYTIARNHCLNLRARRTETLADEEIGERAERPSPPVGRDPSRLLELGELRTALERALGGLPENQRAALILCHYDGLSQREAAEVLGLSESAVKALVHRSKESMLRALGSYLRDTSDASTLLGDPHVAP